MSGSANTDLPVPLPPLPEAGRYWVAFSGGLDSTVLLHWLSRQHRASLTAVHVHHGLQAAADDWAAHCRSLCNQWSVSFRLLHVTVRGAADTGLEAAARQARYAALARLLGPQDVLLTAHHRGDQAETLLLQLLRGSGPHGLAAMSGLGRLGQGQLQRPLLSLGRAALLQYARQHDLHWIEDPSNEDMLFSRNFLRHEVLPVLKSRWPEYERNLARSADLMAEASGLLDVLAAREIEDCRGDMPDSLSVQALQAMSAPGRRNVIRYWLRLKGIPVPNRARMQSIEHDMLTSREDANPAVAWADIELRRYRDSLLVMPQLPPPPGAEVLQWDLQKPLRLPPGCGELVAERAQGAGLCLQSPRLEVRFNQYGERIRPVFSRHHKRLKHLYQEAGVPPWVRERLPLIYHGRRLVAVADTWLAADCAAQADERGWLVHWRGAPVGWLAGKAQTDSVGE